uniref:Uncharacterized protein n=1 Tax=Oryza rufipogon TaxID=4529 RepID=A0A0E0NSC3_ORYRU
MRAAGDEQLQPRVGQGIPLLRVRYRGPGAGSLSHIAHVSIRVCDGVSLSSTSWITARAAAAPQLQREGSEVVDSWLEGKGVCPWVKSGITRNYWYHVWPVMYNSSTITEPQYYQHAQRYLFVIVIDRTIQSPQTAHTICIHHTLKKKKKTRRNTGGWLFTSPALVGLPRAAAARGERRRAAEGRGGAAAPGGEEEEAAVVVGALVGVGEGGVGGVDADEVVGGRGGGVRGGVRVDGACEAAVRVLDLPRAGPRVEAEDVNEAAAAAATWSGATTEVDGEKEAESGGGAAWRRGEGGGEGFVVGDAAAGRNARKLEEDSAGRGDIMVAACLGGRRRHETRGHLRGRLQLWDDSVLLGEWRGLNTGIMKMGHVLNFSSSLVHRSLVQ